MADQKWFGAKTIYQWPRMSGVNAPGEHVYEERVTLLRARDLSDAVVRGEKLAEKYARELGSAEYLRFIDAFEIADDIADGAEVYSITRSSPLSPVTFLDRYYDDGTQRSTRTTEPPPDKYSSVGSKNMTLEACPAESSLPGRTVGPGSSTYGRRGMATVIIHTRKLHTRSK
jgi:hypothetical protein